MKYTICYKSSSEILDVLKSYGLKHDVAFTNNTTKIECLGTTYLVSDRHLKYKELNFIKRVKRHGEKLGKPRSIYSSSDISYFKLYHGDDAYYDDVVEMDVNKAYWQLAYNMGYLSEKLYLDGLEVDKMTRLISFGSMATSKEHYSYDLTTYNFVREEVNRTTRSYFFEIAKQLDVIMCRVANKVGRKNILFYWFDAFFVKKSAVPYMQYLIEQEGLSLKVQELSSIRFKKHKENVYITAIEINERHEDRTDIKIKPFVYPTGNASKRMVSETIDLVKRYMK